MSYATLSPPSNSNRAHQPLLSLPNFARRPRQLPASPATKPSHATVAISREEEKQPTPKLPNLTTTPLAPPCPQKVLTPVTPAFSRSPASAIPSQPCRLNPITPSIVPSPAIVPAFASSPAIVPSFALSPRLVPTPPAFARSPQIVRSGNVLPRAPLSVPNMGRIGNMVGNDNNPWLPPPPEGARDVKIIAMTPIGTICMVPTLDKRPPVTPRYSRPPLHSPGRYITLKVYGREIGPYTSPIGSIAINNSNQFLGDGSKINPQDDDSSLLRASIYLDCSKSGDKDYNHVANKMRSITQNTIALQSKYKNELKTLPDVRGRVSAHVFDNLLSLYENNQVYYQERIDDHSLDKSTISSLLTQLEHWFICIIEPRPRIADDIEAWKERERNKCLNGRSAYCDPELYEYVERAPVSILSFIRQEHIGLL